MTLRLLALIILCAYVENTTAKAAAQINNIGRFGEIPPNCRLNEFRCRNGQCIPKSSICDGRIDCLDNSDETRDECGKSGTNKCSTRQFRCNYGACVADDAPCNGVKDCADNSDENLPKCRTKNRFGDVGDGPSCRGDQFKCNNGQCISNSEICDGNPDCLDRSDENAKICGSHNCPQNVFRCNYGACIDRQLKCDGEVNCADSSDEDPQICPSRSGVPRPSTTTTWRPIESTESASSNRWELQPFQTVTQRPNYATKPATCYPLASASRSAECTTSDGKWISCDSAEVPSGTAAKLSCRSNFMPDQADIISREDVECNAEGVWEPRPINCVSRPSTTTTRRPTTRRQEITKRVAYDVGQQRPTEEPSNSWDGNQSPSQTTSTDRLSPTSLGKTYCSLPPQPKNGRWLLYEHHCPEQGTHCEPESGLREMEQGSVLHYECNDGFKLNTSDSRIFCISGGTWSVIPICEAITCPPLGLVSRYAQCTKPNGDWIPCESTRVPPGTSATIECRTSYTRDTTDLSALNRLRCSDYGNWDPKPFSCVSECGVPNSLQATALIYNGTIASLPEFPWHATLYKVVTGGKKEFNCGASIIKENMVITAAHCVYDDTHHRLVNPSNFYIAVGNKLQQFEHPDHDPMTFRTARVKKIHIKCTYHGYAGNLADDIAILVIDKPFVFNTFLMPICLDQTGASEQSALEVGALGKVAGFGRTETGKLSEVLLSLTVPYVSQNECKAQTAQYNDEKFFTSDKFCAGYTNGSTVCRGDSGGGLVFLTNRKYYLRGIVSAGIGSVNHTSCNAFVYSLYTRVSKHMEWILGTINREEANKPDIPC